MTEDVSREETTSVLSGYTYNDEICFAGIEPMFIVCQEVSPGEGIASRMI